jgi:hypothetical protein
VRNYVECIEGEIDNFTLRNVEIDFFDKAGDLPKSELIYRGNRLLFFKGAKNVTLNGLTVKGGLYGVDTPVEIADCDWFKKKDCNF